MEKLTGLSLNDGSTITVAIITAPRTGRRCLAVNCNDVIKYFNDLSTYITTIHGIGVVPPLSLDSRLLQPIPSIYCRMNERDVMLVHPISGNGDVTLLWCLEDDSIEWIVYTERDTIPEIRVSSGYAQKFGIFPASYYKRLRTLDSQM